ncbi:thiosulfate sulfurtransferase 18-like [Cornus florida]|uniref:thiosulfate sulfurtransferase 18-like n=1 Tax=Cornus florida TaxID=4283 RepID=UPI002897C4C7|nr:thiosulfate sulfurtransferase 18-like [Cornus florida]
MGSFVIPRGLLIVPVLLFLLFVSSSSGAEVVTIDIYKAKALLDSGYTYLDVRSKNQFKDGHVDTNKILNIPFMLTAPGGRLRDPAFLDNVLSAFSKDAQLVVGYQSGVRSLNATTRLVNAGFTHAFNMDGGYVAWVENGFPVKKP